MEKSKKELMNIKRLNMVKAFQKNNMTLIEVGSLEELYDQIKHYIQPGMKVSVGGSMTLFETGIIDLLKENKDITYYDRYKEGMTAEEKRDVFLKSFDADVYLTSTNALTADGCLYNIDGTGNRVASMIYGPKEVLVIAGVNKVFDTEQEAINHIRNVAAPANCLRLNKKTPCTKTGVCMDCHSDDRICSSYVKLAYQQISGRIKVILVNKNIGY